MKKFWIISLSCMFTLIVSTILLYSIQSRMEPTQSNEHFSALTHNEEKSKVKPNKITDYLYELTLSEDDLDYDFARDFFKERYQTKLWACSSVRNDNFVWRNYDWYYDEAPELVVHVPANDNRHASLNIVSFSLISTQDAENGLTEEQLKLLPFIALDWINDAGVAINVNVVPVWDMWFTTWTNPEWTDWSTMNVVRLVLDFADSVDNAVELLKWLNLYSPNVDNFTEEFHFMISDSEKTVIVEFVNNEMVVIEWNIMTNFYVSSEYTPHAAWIERYNLLEENYESGNTKYGMIGLMKSVRYSKAYTRDTNPFWYSEFSADYGEDKYGDLTIDTPHEQYEPVVDKAISYFENRERNSKTWQTVHTSVYDLENKKLTLLPQETGEEFEFSL